MMVESKIIASGLVNGIIEGKHFDRCKRLHPLMAAGLEIFHFDQYLKTKQVEQNFLREQIIEDLLEYQNLDVSHSTTTAELLPNQPNYARWCVEYYENLKNVDETHPGFEGDFKSGCFGIERTDKPFSRIPIDLTLEQTINADAAKRLSGIAHFTNSIAARQRWTKSHSIRAALISHVLDVCGLRYLQDVTADLQPNRIII
ncbi:hypothetical protein JTB14_026512 [Gonioctena quinquepunctata]|nr:hypothetical protein JTB14_026512 [Gonioctena quinquepunctata]